MDCFGINRWIHRQQASEQNWGRCAAGYCPRHCGRDRRRLRLQHVWSTRRDRTKHLQFNRSCDRLGCRAFDLSRDQRKCSTSLMTARCFALRTGMISGPAPGQLVCSRIRVYTLMILDVRTARVIVTLLAFGVAGILLYTARKTLVVVLFAILFAYLLDPLVTWVQHNSPVSRQKRTWAIAQVYAALAIVLGAVFLWMGPLLVSQGRLLAEPCHLCWIKSQRDKWSGRSARSTDGVGTHRYELSSSFENTAKIYWPGSNISDFMRHTSPRTSFGWLSFQLLQSSFSKMGGKCRMLVLIYCHGSATVPS